MTRRPDPVDGADAQTDTTQSLLARAKRGEPDALETLMRRALPALQRWAAARFPRHSWNGMDAEDLVQEAILATLKRIGDFEPAHQHAFQAYLRTAVQNKFRDELRRRTPTTEVAELADRPDPQTRSPLDQAIVGEVVSIYHTAIERLPAPERVALILRLEFDHTFEEIALGMGKPSADSARMTVNRALKRLGALMRKEV